MYKRQFQEWQLIQQARSVSEGKELVDQGSQLHEFMQYTRSRGPRVPSMTTNPVQQPAPTTQGGAYPTIQPPVELSSSNATNQSSPVRPQNYNISTPQEVYRQEYVASGAENRFLHGLERQTLKSYTKEGARMQPGGYPLTNLAFRDTLFEMGRGLADVVTVGNLFEGRKTTQQEPQSLSLIHI